MQKNKLKWLICSITFLLFILISLLVIYDKTDVFDTNIYNMLSPIKSNTLTNIIIIITNFASEITLIILSILILLVVKNKKIGFINILNLINVLLLNQGLKFLFLRERPSEMIITVSGYSYPSGHSMASFAFYGLIIYLIQKSKLNKKLKTLMSTLLVILIFLIGFSRIYLHVHYVSDVLAGYCLTASYLIIFLHYTEKYLKGESKYESKSQKQKINK